MHDDDRSVQHAYEKMADGYADRFGDDLEHTLHDKTVVERALDTLSPSALVLDLGCGTGQVASFVMARGRRAVGIDLTPGMLDVAREVAPQLGLINGNVLRLPVRDGVADAAIAWFSLHNLPRSLLDRALAEIRRVLRPGGVFVMVTHGGEGEQTVSHDWQGRTEQVLVTYYDAEQLRHGLVSQQFEIVDARSRPPMEHEHQAAKVFVTATTRSSRCQVG